MTLVGVAFLLEASYSPLALSSKGENPVMAVPSVSDCDFGKSTRGMPGGKFQVEDFGAKRSMVT